MRVFVLLAEDAMQDLKLTIAVFTQFAGIPISLTKVRSIPVDPANVRGCTNRLSGAGPTIQQQAVLNCGVVRNCFLSERFEQAIPPQGMDQQALYIETTDRGPRHS